MVKCEICGKKIDTTFLKKLIGTYIKNNKGKKHTICFECQSKFKDKEDILKNIK